MIIDFVFSAKKDLGLILGLSLGIGLPVLAGIIVFVGFFRNKIPILLGRSHSMMR